MTLKIRDRVLLVSEHKFRMAYVYSNLRSFRFGRLNGRWNRGVTVLHPLMRRGRARA